MTNLLNAILVLVMTLNLAALGVGRIEAIIRIVALQGALLALLPLLAHDPASAAAGAAALSAAALKGIAIPAILRRALRDLKIKREVEPLIGLQTSVLLGALAAGAALLVADRLPLAEAHVGTLFVPASLATVLTGFLLLTSRFKALSQVMGYLVLENGIYLFGLLLVDAMPLAIEMGILLDLFVGLFVIGIIVHHINQAFSSTDTRRLSALKE